ncbi:uncharacterized protein VTP21DRAFT_1603 [Calcarisporiella thermophila]|uniref:uncharacterized protein n=1 Tax=Calcarisporiella thermophila TaxID=911321 RepID=UPI0037445F82
MATQRLNQITAHLTTAPTSAVSQSAKIGQKSPNDVVIVCALRSPIARAKKGGFKDTLPEEILAQVLKAIIEKTKLDPKLVQDVSVGNVLTPGGAATVSRQAVLYAGFPDTTSVSTINRQCSSGLQAVVNIANSISTGQIDIGIGAGMESMTKYYGPTAMQAEYSDELTSFEPAADCLIPMGETSENVAAEFKISREKQDAFAALSQQRAFAAQEKGLFDEEIVPIKTKVVDAEGNEKEIVVSKDEGVRKGVTAEKLAKLPAAFGDGGSTTAGNASQVSDGAAAVLLMRRSVAEKLNMPILGKFVTAAVVGVPPRVMGIGPAFALPIACEKAGIKPSDLDIVELNEAFASQAVYTIEKVGLSLDKVNPKGGAIALGHPLGCTGARQISTLFTELKRTGKRLGANTMCIGTGMGMAAIFERE